MKTYPDQRDPSERSTKKTYPDQRDPSERSTKKTCPDKRHEFDKHLTDNYGDIWLK